MPYPRFLFFNSTGALVWGSVTTGVAYYAGTLIPLETLVSEVVKVSSIILGVVLLWFATPIAFRWLKEKFNARHKSDQQQDPKSSYQILQSAQEDQVLIPIADEKVMVKQAIDKD
jgi:hypothetical protein